MIRILFSAPHYDLYEAPLARALSDEGLEAEVCLELGDPADIDYILYAPSSPLQDFRPFTKLKAVMSLWAGVERITPNPTLTQPLTRMADSGLREGMVEWVVGHVLRHHLGMDRFIRNTAPHWDHKCPPLARERRVTLLGLGELGLAAARALQQLNFDVAGWSRSEKSIPDLASFHGSDGLARALERTDILVTLLPHTPETENILDATSLARLPRGAVILNPGRGALIDDDALLEALDSGQIGHATLDVFRVEPLPPEHRYWAHPNVTITPHIAADTRASSASMILAENIARAERGEPLLHLVDRARGY